MTAACAIPAILMLWQSAGAVSIDRISAIAGGRIVKESDIGREMRITAFLNREPPLKNAAGPNGSRGSDAEARKAAAGRLIDQLFIREEMAEGGYPPAEPAAAHELYESIRKERAASPAAWDRMLKSYSITAVELERHLLWQLSVLSFIEAKFRPGVIVPEADSRKYYEDHLDALKAANAGKPVSFDDLRPGIEDTLAEARVNQLFYAWLAEKRKESKIEYPDGTLGP